MYFAYISGDGFGMCSIRKRNENNSMCIFAYISGDGFGMYSIRKGMRDNS